MINYGCFNLNFEKEKNKIPSFCWNIFSQSWLEIVAPYKLGIGHCLRKLLFFWLHEARLHHMSFFSLDKSKLFSPNIFHLYLKYGWSCQIWIKKCKKLIEKCVLSKRWMSSNTASVPRTSMPVSQNSEEENVVLAGVKLSFN